MFNVSEQTVFDVNFGSIKIFWRYLSVLDRQFTQCLKSKIFLECMNFLQLSSDFTSDKSTVEVGRLVSVDPLPNV